MAPGDARNWVSFGTELFLTHAKNLPGPSALPGWTRKHLAAHVAANAEALGNLVHWARTGERTPMYASPDQRNADIEAGSQRSEAQLTSWLRDSARSLESAMAALTPEQWQAEVVTAQGRTVPATEIPWLRAREVCVHAVDLGTGLAFADLPEAFLSALVAEIQAKRGLDALPDGPLPDVAAYLAGRPHSLTGVPDLGPWL
ncbi:maleylpyruvate isomerase family mycothiol-dependent enzyme [Amycolatopsis sp. La24]|uniref:maleylpyruvate isomerase family mycothiol-dependent enzyme n=1 Tax=Amycolatopsis sp. La24 TaxID=3028304 RepID=UPI0023AF4A83|nr:maleylpyruvate isomerase family mycothiol-dependent enzyme [Amycolatopsis sp. La24]